MPRESNGHFGKASVRQSNKPTDAELFAPGALENEGSENFIYCINQHSKPEKIKGPNPNKMPFLCNRCRLKWLAIDDLDEIRKRRGYVALAINKNGVAGVTSFDIQNDALRKLRLVKDVSPWGRKGIKFHKKDERKIISRLRDPSLPPV